VTPLARPPDLYYDRTNNRQTQNPPEALQTAQGIIPLNGVPSTQDARFMDVEVQETPRLINSQPSLRMEIEMQDEERIQALLPTLVVTRGGAKTGIPPLDNQGETRILDSDSDNESSSSDDSPKLFGIQDTLDRMTKEVRFDSNPLIQMGLDEDEYQFVLATDIYPPPSPRTRAKPLKTTNPAIPYNLWNDLAKAKADITFGQIIQLAPVLRKEMKEGATVPRIPKRMDQVNKVETIADLRNSKETFDAVEIDVEIVDKIVPRVLVDDGSSVNIMPTYTMKKLGLQVTHPSYVTLRCADQSSVKLWG